MFTTLEGPVKDCRYSMKSFLKALSVDETLQRLTVFPPLEQEVVDIDRSLHRTIAETISAVEDLPPFDRSTMDGFAVRGRDTFGAGESSPALFTLVGEVHMGEISPITLGKGETARVWTGGALPTNADAVVMIEHSQELDAQTIELLKAAAPFENVVRRGEDFVAGTELIRAGQRLRPMDLGLLAALGLASVPVYKQPVVAVISSGDEITAIDAEAQPGCVRDINRYSVSALIEEAYAAGLWVGIAQDTRESVETMLTQGLAQADVVVISGGSSMGARDYVIDAIESIEGGSVLVHGVTVSPGKPLIIGKVGFKAIIGLPGHPVSAMICFEQFVSPLLRRLSGEDTSSPFLRPTVAARLTKNIPSREGRTDFVRIRLERNGKDVTAHPSPGKSGVISAMVRSHGFVRIEADCEGLYKGDTILVHLFSNWFEDEREKKHLLGHEIPGRRPESLLGPARQEHLSGT